MFTPARALAATLTIAALTACATPADPGPTREIRCGITNNDGGQPLTAKTDDTYPDCRVTLIRFANEQHHAKIRTGSSYTFTVTGRDGETPTVTAISGACVSHFACSDV